MAFKVFPDAAHGPLVLGGGLVSGPFAFDAPPGATVVLRMVKTLGGCDPPGGLASPTLRLQAGEGPPADVDDRSGPVSIRDRDDVGSAPVATATFTQALLDVAVFKIVVHRAAGNWRFRIRNNDRVDRLFTWVVADNSPESEQPWINLPQEVRFDAFVGDDDVAKELNVPNLGTGTLKLSTGGLTPDTGFRLQILRREARPNSCAKIRIAFRTPDAPSVITGLYVATSNDRHAMESAGHNDHVVLRATTSVRPDVDTPDPVVPDPPIGGLCRRCSLCPGFQARQGVECQNCPHNFSQHEQPV